MYCKEDREKLNNMLSHIEQIIIRLDYADISKKAICIHLKRVREELAEYIQTKEKEMQQSQ